jgi:hypothetical protein
VRRVIRIFWVGVVMFGTVLTASLVEAPGSSAATNAGQVPVVSNVSPDSGPGSGGTLITITGLHLQNVDKVEFVSGSVSARGRHVVDVNSHEVQVTSPPGSPNDSPYDITLTDSKGTSATNSGDEFSYTADPTPGKISVHSSNLSFDKADSLTVVGRGWTPGLLVLVTICNADASDISPFTQIASFDFTPNACDPITLSLGAGGSFAQVNLSGPKAGDFTWTGTLDPGQLDPSVNSPLAECPQDQSQVAEGIRCIIGVAELVGLSSDGNTADQSIYFSPPKLHASRVWQSGLGSAAEWDVTLYDLKAYSESDQPPVTSGSGVPNTGGFATDGLICEPGTGPGSSPPEPCVAELNAPTESKQGVWTQSPTGCQGASSVGGTSWSSTPLCTYGEATGEPIEIELTSYTAPVGTSLTNPIPLDVPLDCSGGSSSTDLFTCSVQANAGSNVFDPGGFNSNISNASTGQAPPTALQDLQPGTYTFEAIGADSGNTTTTTVTLPLGPPS